MAGIREGFIKVKGELPDIVTLENERFDTREYTAVGTCHDTGVNPFGFMCDRCGADVDFYSCENGSPKYCPECGRLVVDDD